MSWASGRRIRFPHIAIDFGTSFCRVALYDPKSKTVEVFVDLDGCDRQCCCVNSYVNFTDNGRFIGCPGGLEASRDPVNAVPWIKLFLGQTPSKLEEIKSRMVCRIDTTTDDHIQICNYFPEEIAAMIMSKMRGIAEHRLKRRFLGVFITVPSCFTAIQRRTIVDSGNISGFRSVHLVNDNTAAAIAYAQDFIEALDAPKRVLFYDIGAGHATASIIRVSKTECRVQATAGNSQIGGDEIDQRMADIFSKDLMQYHTDVLPVTGKWIMWRLRNFMERVKRSLSSLHHVDIQLKHVFPFTDYSKVVSRTEFESMCSDLFTAAVEPIRTVLSAANITADSLDEVVILGGSSRIPKIQALIAEICNHRRINKTFHSEETVVRGAAIYAAQFVDDVEVSIRVLDVVPHGFGIEQPGLIVSNIVPANTQIPCSLPFAMATSATAGTATLILSLYEGMRALTSENLFLGSVRLQKQFSVFGGSPETRLEFVVDSSGILGIELVLEDGREPLKMSLEVALDAKAKIKAKQRFTRSVPGDTAVKIVGERRQHLKSMVYMMRATNFSHHVEPTDADVAFVCRRCTDLLGWLAQNPRAALTEIEEKIKEAHEQWQMLVRGGKLRHIWNSPRTNTP